MPEGCATERTVLLAMPQVGRAFQGDISRAPPALVLARPVTMLSECHLAFHRHKIGGDGDAISHSTDVSPPEAGGVGGDEVKGGR